MAFNFNNVYFSYFVISWTNFELVNFKDTQMTPSILSFKGYSQSFARRFWYLKRSASEIIFKFSIFYLFVSSMKCTTINTSSKLVDICSRGNRIRKVLDSEVAIYLFQIFKCFCCWHASLLPKRWEGSKTHHTLLMTLYGGLCNRAHSKFVY